MTPFPTQMGKSFIAYRRCGMCAGDCRPGAVVIAGSSDRVATENVLRTQFRVRRQMQHADSDREGTHKSAIPQGPPRPSVSEKPIADDTH
jgi:hypothetical protein